jgi:hypothetical protein
MEYNTTQWASINFQGMHTRDRTVRFMMDQNNPRRDMMMPKVIGRKKHKWKEVMTMAKGEEDLGEEVLHAAGPEEAEVEDLEAPEVDLAAEARRGALAEDGVHEEGDLDLAAEVDLVVEADLVEETKAAMMTAKQVATNVDRFVKRF